jgi:lipopolysaccharide export system ATP-binding protein
MTNPDGGRVMLRGEEVTRWPMYIRAQKGGMGYLPQQSSVFGKLSAEDNLRGIMQLLGMSRKEQKMRTDELLEQFKITHIRKTAAGRLSGGERRRLEIARCLISNPQIIMLDEPFAGIDPVTVQNIQLIILELANKGISILITDHAAREILQITDRTYVVSEGKILCSGTTEEIVKHEEVKLKYLGEIEIARGGKLRVPGGRDVPISTPQKVVVPIERDVATPALPSSLPTKPKFAQAPPSREEASHVRPFSPFRSTDLD